MKIKGLFSRWVIVWITGFMMPVICASQIVSAGSSHSLFVCSDSTVMAWGMNGAGQLGNGSLLNSKTPTHVPGLHGMIAVSSGELHSLALKQDGTVWAWGDNSFGQLGNGTLLPQLSPVQVSSLSNVIAIATQANHSLALKGDGTVWAWGDNFFGQLGNNSTINSSVPVQVVSLTSITSIAAGQFHSIALKSDSTIWAWGMNSQGQLGNNSTANGSMPVQVVGLTSVTAIAGGGFHTLALQDNGDVWAWGLNAFGQLGNGTMNGDSTPVQVLGLPTIASIAAGSMHSLARQSTGEAWTWGQGTAGQLGNGGLANSLNPIQVAGLVGISALAGGQIHTLALQNRHLLWANGTNADGELGDGTTTRRLNPVTVIGLCPPHYAAPDSTFTEFFSPNTGGINRWIAGELATSIPLPNGKIMWLFGRSHIDNIAIDNTIPCQQQEVDNCILLQDSTPFGSPTTYLDITTGATNKSFFKLSPTDSTILRPGHGYVQGDTAFVFLSRWDSNSVFLGNYVAKVGITTMNLEDISKCISHTFLDFGKAVVVDSLANYIYLYGSKEDVFSMRKPYVARRSYTNASGTWEYYGAPGWFADTAMARPISTYEVAASFSISKLQGRYYLVTQDKAPDPFTCGIQRNILAYRSDSLTGPFTNLSLLYTTEDTYDSLPILSFDAYAHPYLSTCDSLLLSYDVRDLGDTTGITQCPSQCWRSNLQDADTWRPKFIRVPYPLMDSTLSTNTVASFTSVNNGNNTWTFTNTSTFATMYIWDFGDGNTSTLVNPVHSYASPGNYVVTLVAYGCGVGDTSLPFVGIQNPEDPFPSLHIFPNPSTGHFQIQAQHLGKGPVTIEILSIVGQNVMRQTYQPLRGSFSVQIDLGVASGIYILRLESGGGIVTKKLVLH